MARQEQVFAQTIMDMKRAMGRKADDSEADDFIQKPTNRGNKRKRGAKFVQEGRLDLANPIKRSRKSINYNGYVRDIISKNSLRVDPDGDVFEDDEDSTLELSDYEEDAYKEVRIEELLMPLTSAGALKDHPTMSIPYTSKALDEIIHSAQEMVQREQNNLWRLKQLTNGLRGDAPYMPCGIFETENDALLIEKPADRISHGPYQDSSTELTLTTSNGSGATNAPDTVDLSAENGPPPAEVIPKAIKELRDFNKAARSIDIEQGVAREDHEPHANGNAHNKLDSEEDKDIEIVDAPNTTQEQSTSELGEQAKQEQKELDSRETMEMEDGQENGEGDDSDTQPQHRMTTRAKAAEAAPSPTLSATSYDDLPPHPFFLLPPNILPSRDLGLPPNEAAETRKLLAAFIQKQEDAVRNSWKLLNGLLKAKRYRDNVLEWCTAEAHVGEMSDGEDWYDKEFWGLEGDLKKGVEEQEGEGEETGPGGRKKTRRARAAAA